VKHRAATLLLALIVSGASAVALAQAPAQPAGDRGERRRITEKDLFDFVWIADPQVAPDGSQVAFTRVVADAKRTGYETSIWLTAVRPSGGREADAGLRRLTSGKHDALPRWSPDGRRLVFVRGGEQGADGKSSPPQIAVLSLAGGEAWTITDLPRGASDPAWSPDGRRILFLSSTTPEDLKKQAEKDRPQQGRPDAAQKDDASPHESDVRVITRAVYRSNDEGYLDATRHSHIWVIDVPASSDQRPKPAQLTSGNFDEREPLWAPDGSRIYFTTTRIDEPYYELPTTDVCSVSPAGGGLQKVATLPMDIGDLAISPDNRRLAFHGAVTQPVRSYSQPDVWLMELTPSAPPRNLTAKYDFDMGSGVGGDNAAPRGGGTVPRCTGRRTDVGCSMSWRARVGRYWCAWTRKRVRSRTSRAAIRR
jgi:dipeptidyl aminopeptidase/acylaminoacyl peptidase